MISARCASESHHRFSNTVAFHNECRYTSQLLCTKETEKKKAEQEGLRTQLVPRVHEVHIETSLKTHPSKLRIEGLDQLAARVAIVHCGAVGRRAARPGLAVVADHLALTVQNHICTSSRQQPGATAAAADTHDTLTIQLLLVDSRE